MQKCVERDKVTTYVFELYSADKKLYTYRELDFYFVVLDSHRRLPLVPFTIIILLLSK